MTELAYAQKINREWHGQYFIEYAQVQLKQASIDLEKGDIASYKACLSEVATSLGKLAELEKTMTINTLKLLGVESDG